MSALKLGDRITFPVYLKDMEFKRQTQPYNEFILVTVVGRREPMWISMNALTRVSGNPAGLSETFWYLYHQKRGLLRMAMFLRGKTIVCTDIQLEMKRMRDGTFRVIKYPIFEVE